MTPAETKDKIDQLIDMVSHIEKIEWGGGEVIGKTDEGKDILSFPYAIYPKGLYEGLCDLYDIIGPDHEYLDHMDVPVEEAVFEDISLEKAGTFLTWMLRGERFCEGLMADMIEKGYLLRLLKRIRELI